MFYLRRLLEKLFIIAFCLYNTYKKYPDENLPLYFLIVLIISSLLELIENRNVKLFLYAFFAALTLFNQPLIMYVPLIVYDLYEDFKWFIILAMPLIFVDFYVENLMFSIFTAYISIITSKQNETLEENIRARDKIKEDSLLLQKYNEQLRKDREKNVHIAVLTERNRIAKELHDAIGHSLSSSILQVESLKIITKDKSVLEKLDVLQETLIRGMDDIRRSIHNLYSESVDLKEQIEKLCASFPNIDIELVYKINDNLSFDMKYDILSIIKEGITNCAKHSDADKLKIILLEQPKFYSLVLKDNGSKFDEEAIKNTRGIGLLSIKEIAHKYNGFLNYSYDNGFKLHVTLMKG